MNDIVCNWNPINNWQQHHKILNGFDIWKVMAFVQCRVYSVQHTSSLHNVHLLSFNSLELHESMGWRWRLEKNAFGWNRAEYMNKQIFVLQLNTVRLFTVSNQIEEGKKKNPRKKETTTEPKPSEPSLFLSLLFSAAVVCNTCVCIFFFYDSFRQTLVGCDYMKLGIWNLCISRFLNEIWLHKAYSSVFYKHNGTNYAWKYR